MTSKVKTIQLVFSSMFLCLALILPLVTGQIPEIGNALCPMHIPVLLCGFFVGPIYGMIIGFMAPLLRTVVFGMPPLIPIGLAMCFELAAYGFVSGFLYRKLKKNTAGIYISLLTAMVAGRLLWGLVRICLYGLTGSEFGFAAFMAGAFLNAIPGIIIQLILIPVLVKIFHKYAL